MNIWKTFDRFFDRVINIAGVLGAALMLFIMLIVCAGVFTRNVFNKPIPGVEEIAQDCLLYAGFLMAAWLMRKNGHAKVDLLINYLKPKTRAAASIVLYSVCALICLILTWFGVKVVTQDLAFHLRETSYLMIPTWILIIIIPIGYFLIFTQVLKTIAKFRQDLKTASVTTVAGNTAKTERTIKSAGH
jgi:C4-dicarboxylate transporter, DctQ subunit